MRQPNYASRTRNDHDTGLPSRSINVSRVGGQTGHIHLDTWAGFITLAVAHAKLALPVTALVAIAVAVVVMWVVMVLVARGGPRASGAGSLMHDMVTRFMGLIVIAMGVQFALTGFRNFFS